MWLEWLTEIVPGLVILACLLLWWQTQIDLHAMRRDWDEKLKKLSGADSWNEASAMLKAYTEDSDA